MRDHADTALKQLEKLIARDPLLRDIVSPAMPSPRRAARFEPAVDVLETDGGWVILVDVPGVARDALRIRLEGHRLILSGERAHDRLGVNAVRVGEREGGRFRREFLLPFDVRADAIRADLDAGVLRVELPRSGVSAERDIPIG
jgi:HSP20 family protein